MQQVNDDMDNLLRKAAEAYPLNTSGADWNQVLHKLQEPEEKVNPRSRSYLWLLLLLLGFVCNTNKVGKEVKVYAGGFDIKASRNTSLNMQPKDRAFTQAINANNKIEIDKINKTKILFLQDLKDRSSKVDRTVFKSTSHDIIQKIKKAKNEKKDGHLISNASVFTFKENSDPAITQSINSIEKINAPAFSFNNREWPVAAPGYIVEKTQKNIASVNKRKQFYLGILGGVDLTTVQFQRMENPGFDIGAILGYQFTKQVAIETGLIYNKKLYYSKGSQFNTDKMGLASNAKLTDVNGACFMWELPLLIRYTFPSQRKATWFGAIGISNYIMSRENYNYTYYYLPSSPTYIRHREYKEGNMEWLSSLQLSGGIQKTIGKVGTLRIEPFIKLPVRNIGIGSLPMQSSGIRFAFTKNLF